MFDVPLCDFHSCAVHFFNSNTVTLHETFQDQYLILVFARTFHKSCTATLVATGSTGASANNADDDIAG